MFQVQVDFTSTQISDLLLKGLRIWQIQTSATDVEVLPDEQSGCHASLKVDLPGDLSITLSLDYHTISRAIAEASAAAGICIDPTSLKFRFPHFGRIINPEDSRRALGASANLAAAFDKATRETPGAILFAHEVSGRFGQKRLGDLLTCAAAREGWQTGLITFHHHETNGCSASVAVTINDGQPGSINLNQSQLDRAIKEELTRRGYVLADPTHIKYFRTRSEDAENYETVAIVYLTAIPRP